MSKRGRRAATGVVFLALAVWLGTADAHQTNVVYLLWKTGLTPGNWRVGTHYLGRDTAFQTSLCRRTERELARWFPVLVKPSQGNAHQRRYMRRPDMVDANCRWVGDTDWAILFQNGRVTSIMKVKG